MWLPTGCQNQMVGFGLRKRSHPIGYTAYPILIPV
jgi:hypothetical protein